MIYNFRCKRNSAIKTICSSIFLSAYGQIFILKMWLYSLFFLELHLFQHVGSQLKDSQLRPLCHWPSYLSVRSNRPVACSGQFSPKPGGIHNSVVCGASLPFPPYFLLPLLPVSPLLLPDWPPLLSHTLSDIDDWVVIPAHCRWICSLSKTFWELKYNIKICFSSCPVYLS